MISGYGSYSIRCNGERCFFTVRDSCVLWETTEQCADCGKDIAESSAPRLVQEKLVIRCECGASYSTREEAPADD